MTRKSFFGEASKVLLENQQIDTMPQIHYQTLLSIFNDVENQLIKNGDIAYDKDRLQEFVG
ncbi:hypothetical protein [Companilactobacillus farciminis]|uniref:hypothetical protein n=1 Tax=Companilactobacillus farciminis TaxID=1612 RepID=UPI00241C033B|nr:hypothetical protein [Companilactobacillus farciminis]